MWIIYFPLIHCEYVDNHKTIYLQVIYTHIQYLINNRHSYKHIYTPYYYDDYFLQKRF